MKHKLKLKSLAISDLSPIAMPHKLIPIPDYAALLAYLRVNDGWAVVKTDPAQDRPTVNGSTEAPVIKAFNSHVRSTLKKALYTRRLARDAWYLELKE